MADSHATPTTTEEWRDVPGWEDSYQVSDHGRVRSLDRAGTRTNGGRYQVKGRVLKPGRNAPDGYLFVTLSVGGDKLQRYVHDLVLTAFVEPRPEGLEARHYDDVRENNHLRNLAWGTRSENNFDRVRNGGHPMAAKTHCLHGHAFTPDNIYWSGEGRHRHCKTCTIERNRKYARRRAGLA